MDAVHGIGAKHTRLRVLIDFLESMPDDKVQIAMTPTAPRHSRVLVGNWFLAESQTGNMQSGYRNTLFTRHAATVRHCLQEFDLLFDGYAREDQSFTRTDAIDRLQSELDRTEPPEGAADAAGNA